MNLSIKTPEGFVGTIVVNGIEFTFTGETLVAKVESPTLEVLTRHYKVKSSKDSKVFYTVSLGPKGENCTCKAFEFSKATPKTCKHIQNLNP